MFQRLAAGAGAPGWQPVSLPDAGAAFIGGFYAAPNELIGIMDALPPLAAQATVHP